MKVHATLQTRCGCTKQVVVEGAHNRPPQEVKVALQTGQAWRIFEADPAALTYEIRIFDLEHWHPATPNIDARAEYYERR